MPPGGGLLLAALCTGLLHAAAARTNSTAYKIPLTINATEFFLRDSVDASGYGNLAWLINDKNKAQTPNS